MTVIAISELVLLAAVIVVALGRGIAGRRFERELRLITLDDEDGLADVRPIAPNVHGDTMPGPEIRRRSA